jgi:hypothetical protein
MHDVFSPVIRRGFSSPARSRLTAPMMGRHKIGIDSLAAASYLVSAMLLHARQTPPGFIGPSLPCPADRPPSGFGWIHEIKHHGFRMMVRSTLVPSGLLATF